MNPTRLSELNANWESVAPLLLHFNDSRVPDNHKSIMSNKIRDHYLKNASLSNMADMETRTALIQVMRCDVFDTILKYTCPSVTIMK